MTKARLLLYACVVVALCAFLGCSPTLETSGPEYGATPVESLPVYRFAVHPLYNPTNLFTAYQPLVTYLNQHLKNVHFILEASRDYATYEEKYNLGEPDFLLPNPWQTLQAMRAGYTVIAMAGDPADFKGIFIVRKDSSIVHPADLKGKAVSYPAPTALAACIMPQYFLYQNGVNINTDIENRYVGSQESAILNVYMGLTAAGVTWPPPWRDFQRTHPQEAADLKVIWETEPLINNSVMARKDIPVELQAQVQSLLIGLGESQEGRAILAGMETTRFSLAGDRDYDPVQAFISLFEKDVRKVDLK